MEAEAEEEEAEIINLHTKPLCSSGRPFPCDGSENAAAFSSNGPRLVFCKRRWFGLWHVEWPFVIATGDLEALIKHFVCCVSPYLRVLVP